MVFPCRGGTTFCDGGAETRGNRGNRENRENRKNRKNRRGGGSRRRGGKRGGEGEKRENRTTGWGSGDGAGAVAGGVVWAGPEGAAGVGASFGQAFLHGFSAEGAGRGIGGGFGDGTGGDSVAGKGFGEASLGEKFGMGAFELAGEHDLEAGNEDDERAGGHEGVGRIEPAGEFGALGEDVEGDVAVEIGTVVGAVEVGGEDGAGVGVGFGPRGFVGEEKEGAEVAREFGKGGAGDVEELHLGFAGGGAAGVSFGDVGGGGTGGHGHLVEETAAGVDVAGEVAEAEAADGVFNEGGEEPGIEPVVRKGGLEGRFGRGVHGGWEFIGGRGGGTRGKWGAAAQKAREPKEPREPREPVLSVLSGGRKGPKPMGKVC